MSVTTNPVKEPSVTCGFYNSIGGDRKFDSLQMSQIFDGVISDGIFATWGKSLIVNSISGNTVNIDTGKAWFNHTWTINDAILPVDCGKANAYYNRIDAIMIRVDQRDAVRDNFIEVVKGVEATKPVKPTGDIVDPNVFYYPLCYVYRPAGSTEITMDNITNAVGVESPFVTGLLDTIDPELLVREWTAKLDTFLTSEKARAKTEIDTYIKDNEESLNKWYSEMRSLMEDAIAETTNWTTSQKNTILDWFYDLKGQLSEDAATNIYIRLTTDEIVIELNNGFVGSHTTNISEDGTTITSIDYRGYTLAKKFTNNFLTCTTVMTDNNGTEIGRLVKNFSENGNTISSETWVL